MTDSAEWQKSRAFLTNTGSRHFSEIDKRFYEKKYLQFVEQTTKSNITFVLNAVHNFKRNGKPENLEADVAFGVWQCVVYGFGGVRMLNGNLRICPRLPKNWDELTFTGREKSWK